jgi:SAM-dependent methyltransferase
MSRAVAPRAAPAMPLYAATIFVSAFLLFLVQPVMAKQILPWFGGTAAVWTTCLVFFQTALLAGYAYSDLAMHRLTPRAQIGAHTVLLVLSLVLLPIVPAGQWKPAGTENPSWLILGLLTATIGLPYFLLSTTSPLVQAWFARSRPGESPYRLFALSNLASMLALVGYPFLFEPWVPTRTQALLWSAGYALFVALTAVSGWTSLKRITSPRSASPAAVPNGGPADGPDDAPPSLARQMLWCALAATGSLLLLAVSNHITQNVASVPLLWIVPLALYLLTFILCFDSTGWYRRHMFLAMLAAGLPVMAWTLADSKYTHDLAIQMAVFCAGLFLACMFCHGELVRLRPSPRYLTRFYLMMSLGGALGSVLVGILAPVVLPAYFELAGGLLVAALLLAWQVRREHLVFSVLAVASVLGTAGCAVWSVREFYEGTVAASRNFYGVLRVQEFARDSAINHRRSLVHGTILHGTQYLSPALRRQPTTYYTQTSGIGRAIEGLHPSLRPLRIGVIGLGTGTLAAYGAKGDVIRFYEINPKVPEIAREYFSFLTDSEATIEIARGDARLSLEREAPQQFDVLAIDAFSSDAIPVHLITAEALGVYKRHMKPGGIIAFHVTNRYLDLIPVVAALSQVQNMYMIHIADEGEMATASRSDWLLLSDRRESLDRPQLTDAATEVEQREDWRLWTDDFNNIVQVLK